MIEIQHYAPNHKQSALKAKFNVVIQKWGGFVIRDMCLFESDNKRWITYPSRDYEVDGKKKYFSFNGFLDKAMDETFKSKVMEALDQFLKNPSVKDDKPLNPPF